MVVGTQHSAPCAAAIKPLSAKIVTIKGKLVISKSQKVSHLIGTNNFRGQRRTKVAAALILFIMDIMCGNESGKAGPTAPTKKLRARLMVLVLKKKVEEKNTWKKKQFEERRGR